MFFKLLLCGFVCLFGASFLSATSAEQTLQRARDYVGEDSRLRAVNALQFEGTVMDPEGKQIGKMRLQFKKPYQQRATVWLPMGKEIKATNGYEGFAVLHFEDKSKAPRMQVYDFGKVQEMIINAAENLYFFEGYKQRRGTLVDGGIVEFDGKKAHKLRFEYPHDMWFERYFDPETGQLYGTLIHNGRMSKEKEPTVVDGIRLPQRLMGFKDGELEYEIYFDTILINPELPQSLFEYPSLNRAKEDNF